ncbi:MAG: hypothetical protein A2020_14790 [Lentisphaerae bacterium GWF2_45_14]|nr:MAG: hypothetical protein A2020_14790 [Lentisphaerae bacterium GWF2_45_14]
MQNHKDDKVSFKVEIPIGENNLTGRECPKPECLGYFKVQFGTGLKGENLPCHCPYCGHIGPHTTFLTPEQVEYAKSVALNQFTEVLLADLKKMEFESRPLGGFGLSVSMKVSGGTHPIYYYREKQLETEVVCEHCTLRYAVYGVFAFCPDCGLHNSLQIFNKSMELIVKMLDMSTSAEDVISSRLIENALGDCVSAFDGFGREVCHIRAGSTASPDKIKRLSFQNLEGARRNILDMFNYDVSTGLTTEEWFIAAKCFQKRHLLSHKMGVVDGDYISKTGDANAIIGRKITVTSEEVRTLVQILYKLAHNISIESGK